MSLFQWKKDIDAVSINVMLLFETFQLEALSLPFYERRRMDLAAVFKAHPHIEWFARHKAPAVNDWLDELLREDTSEIDVNRAERKVLYQLEDWVTYVTTPDDYDILPFNGWDKRELTELTDYSGKTVVDVGSGTGRLALDRKSVV